MISAIILAAGQSKRMGQPKMLLPWGNGTVLSHVISVFQHAGVEDIIIVTGGAKEQVDELVSSFGVRTVYNQDYTNGEMLLSLQCGLQVQEAQAEATLIALGDQPQVQEGSVQKVCEAFTETKSNLIVPSYQMRRGHHWLVARPLWGELLKMESPQSPRDFLNAHQAEIQYINMDDPNILADLDTPEDYLKFKP